MDLGLNKKTAVVTGEGQALGRQYAFSSPRKAPTSRSWTFTGTMRIASSKRFANDMGTQLESLSTFRMLPMCIG